MARRSNRKNVGSKLSQVLAAEKASDTLNDLPSRPSSLPLLRESVRCVCGVAHDDGGHMLLCDICLSWSYSSCNGLLWNEAEKVSDFACSSWKSVLGLSEPHPPTEHASAEPLPVVSDASPIEPHPTVAFLSQPWQYHSNSYHPTWRSAEAK